MWNKLKIKQRPVLCMLYICTDLQKLIKFLSLVTWSNVSKIINMTSQKSNYDMRVKNFLTDLIFTVDQLSILKNNQHINKNET